MDPARSRGIFYNATASDICDLVARYSSRTEASKRSGIAYPSLKQLCEGKVPVRHWHIVALSTNAPPEPGPRNKGGRPANKSDMTLDELHQIVAKLGGLRRAANAADLALSTLHRYAQGRQVPQNAATRLRALDIAA